MTSQEIIQQVYDAFNKRDIATILKRLHPEVAWPNGWEGGYVYGHQEVRDYWTRQWKEIDPNVDPIDIALLHDNRVEVSVRQVVRDVNGTLLADGSVIHTYTLEDGLIRKMVIQQVD